jgi:hypothetical protein
VSPLSTTSAPPNSPPTEAAEPGVAATFTAEQRGLATEEPSVSLVPVVTSLLNTYAGLSAAVAGFVLDNTAIIVVGMMLVGSGSVWSI